MPSTKIVRRVYKPILFVVCALPLLWLVAGIAEQYGPRHCQASFHHHWLCGFCTVDSAGHHLHQQNDATLRQTLAAIASPGVCDRAAGCVALLLASKEGRARTAGLFRDHCVSAWLARVACKSS